MSVFLTHSYENLFLLLLIPLHTSTLLGCLHELPLPLGPFPTHCLLSSQTTSSFSYSDLGCLCSYLLQCVLSPGIVHLLSLPVHPQPNPFLNPDHHCHHCEPHTLQWHREEARLLVSPVQFPHCALLSSHTHLLSPELGRDRNSLSTVHVCIVHCKSDPQF